MKYRIEIWLDKPDVDILYDHDSNFEYSCEPPEEKYSRYISCVIISEKMRELVENKKPSLSAMITIRDYMTGILYAKNYIYDIPKYGMWIMNYMNDSENNIWYSRCFPYNEV